MSKKILTLLLALFWCFTLSAQDLAEVSPNLTQVKHNPELEAIWDVEFNYDAVVVTGAAGNAGAVYIPTINKFWTSRWATGIAHQWNADGTLDVQFTLPFTGTRGMCFDGQYVYHSTNSTTVQIVDPVTKAVVGTIPVNAAPNGARYITYNPDGNSGAGSIIVGNWTSPNFNFYEFSMTGTLLRTITNTITGVYGIAYDYWSAGGPFLWVWSQGAGAGTPQLIHQMDYTSGTYTGVTHDVVTDIAAGIAGGLFITDQLIPGEVTLGGMLQGNPDTDRLFGYELTTISNPSFTEDFEGFTVGGQVACQDPVNWTPWPPALPCDPVVDAFVSSNYAFSGTKSVVVVQNNDLVKPLGDKTSGKWYISFLVYIPQGKSGYFNTLCTFTPPSTFVWGHDCFFDAGGAGRLDITGGGGSGTIVNFTWTVAQWNQVVVIVDLDSPTHLAEFWIGTNPSNFAQVANWDWTNAGAKPNTLAANDFYGFAATDEMYFDDYYFSDVMPPIIPVELTSFAANVNDLGQVVLNWETATEVNNQGFEIQKRTESSEFRTIGFIEGFGTTTEPKSYSFIDKNADQGINYYRLKQVDFDGSYAYSDIVEADVTAPATFDLAQNYPNPFNPSTSIKYSIPEAGNIRLSVFNIVGEEVAVLAEGFSQAGFFEVTFDASNLSTGVYLYKLQSANSVQIKKMMLLK